MPAAELFTTWAVAEAAAESNSFKAVIAVGDSPRSTQRRAQPRK
jgi:hypothetical protein